MQNKLQNIICSCAIMQDIQKLLRNLRRKAQTFFYDNANHFGHVIMLKEVES